MRIYIDLDVWKQPIELDKDVCMLVKSLPKEKAYVLSDQTKPSAISLTGNIAEGSARNGTKEFIWGNELLCECRDWKRLDSKIACLKKYMIGFGSIINYDIIKLKDTPRNPLDVSKINQFG